MKDKPNHNDHQLHSQWKNRIMKNIELLPNKILSLLLLIIGFLMVSFERDGTILLLLLPMTIPMFFAKKNWTIFQIISEELDDEQKPEKEYFRLSRSNGIRSTTKFNKRARSRAVEQTAVNDSVHI